PQSGVQNPESGVQSQKTGAEGSEDFFLTADDYVEPVVAQETVPVGPNLKSITDVPHEYHLVSDAAGRAKLVKELCSKASFCFDTETTSLDVKAARLVGLAFSLAPHTGYYVPVPQDEAEAKRVL